MFAARSVPKVCFQLIHHYVRVNITHNDDCLVLRLIPTMVEIAYQLWRTVSDNIHVAYGTTFRIGGIIKDLVQNLLTRRRSLAHSPFLYYNITLTLHVFIRDDNIISPIAHQQQTGIQQ